MLLKDITNTESIVPYTHLFYLFISSHSFILSFFNFTQEVTYYKYFFCTSLFYPGRHSRHIKNVLIIFNNCTLVLRACVCVCTIIYSAFLLCIGPLVVSSIQQLRTVNNLVDVFLCCWWYILDINSQKWDCRVKVRCMYSFDSAKNMHQEG